VDAQLKDILTEARIKVQQADGLPLSAEDQAMLAEQAAVRELQDAWYTRFMGKRLLGFSNRSRPRYDAQGAFIQITIDDKQFQLRRDGSLWNMTEENGSEPRQIVSIEDSDPLFCERVIAAVSERL
jgi:hypothetical protein